MKKILTFLSLLIFSLLNARATVVYVDSSNTAGFQDGSEWTYAFTSLQTAINAANAGDSVFVAKATYLPATGSSFVLKEGVKVFGGFLNTDTTFLQRSYTNNKTILKGNGNSVIRNNNNGLTAASLIDGFTFTNELPAFLNAGAGIYNRSASPSINNCTFSRIIADPNDMIKGGAIYNESSSPSITNCTFTGNKIGSTTLYHRGFGAAIHNESSSPLIYNCSFSGDTCYAAGGSGGGGAISNLGASAPTISYCTFSGNIVLASSSAFSVSPNHFATFGGAILNGSTLTVNISHCTFDQNSSTCSYSGPANSQYYAYGGAIFSGPTSYIFGSYASNLATSMNISNCIFTNNISSVPYSPYFNYAYGGAIYAENESTINMDSCFFNANKAVAYGYYPYAVGGAIHCSTVGTFSNCNFSNNIASATSTNGLSYTLCRAGAILYYSISTLPFSLVNCTFTGNSSIAKYTASLAYRGSGGALYCAGTNNVLFDRCQFSANKSSSGGALYNEATQLNIRNSIFAADTAIIGGGIYNSVASPKITNCLFSKNIVDSVGAGIFNYQSSPQIINTIITQNRATLNGSGMTSNTNSSPVFTNTILWGNNTGVFNDGTSLTAATYSLIQGFPASIVNHNIAGTTNPLLADTAADNYHLQVGSPCIDAGNSTANVTTTDLDGNTRIAGGAIDMGPYESGSIPLPLGLISFTGQKKQDGAIILSWQIKGEESMAFILQRSHDGKLFTDIHSGNATEKEHNFTYIDEVPEAINYYRLALGNANGVEQYSNTVVIKTETLGAQISIFPNPVKKSMTIHSSAAGLPRIASLSDIFGKTVKTIWITSDNQTISLSDLKSGLYFLRVTNGHAIKIIKE